MVDQRFDIQAAIEEKKTKKKVFKANPIKNNLSLEAEYYSELRKMLQVTKDFFVNTVVEGLNKEYIKEQIVDASPYALITQLINNVKGRINSRYDISRLKSIAEKFVNKTNTYHETRFDKNIQAGIGIDISQIPDFQNLKPYIASVVKKNLSMITTLRNENLHRLENTLRNSVDKGYSISKIKEDILSSYDVSKKKAATIARNELKNLQSQLNKKRMQNLGMDLYTWETAGDERVRGRPGGKYPNAKPDHWEMQGLICKFGDPSVYSKDGGKTWKKRLASMPTGAPGDDINCRCIAQPYINLSDDDED